MKAGRIVALAFLIPAFVLMIGQSCAREGQSSEEQEMMDATAKYGTPGEHHKLLDPGIGKWNLTATLWTEPGAEPQISTGTSECKWILGERYVQENITGEVGGSPFHGLGFTGYDIVKQKYFSFWIDDISTSYLTSEGTVDSTGRVFTMSGSYDDPMSGKKNRKFKGVTRVIDDNNRLYEMYEYDASGNEWESLEIKYIRATE